MNEHFLPNTQTQTQAQWPDWLQEAACLLRDGQVVAFPTETVYGLGANALDSSACARIFAAKGRPADNPLIVHISSVEEAQQVVEKWSGEAEVCAQAFWPGPLTLVLPKKTIIPDIVSGGLATVGVRMPAHPIALSLIRASGCPLAAPSANISGKPSPTEGEHVWQDLQGVIPLLLDAGQCAVGLESTVLDLTGPVPMVLRPGGVTLEQLHHVLGRVELDPGITLEKYEKPKSPGMKYKHYAPQGELVLINGDIEKKADGFTAGIVQNTQNRKLAIIGMKETLSRVKSEILGQAELVFTLGSESNLTEAASHLFEALRKCDELNIEVILAEEIPAEGIGLAFMNRLRKAAGNQNSSEADPRLP